MIFNSIFARKRPGHCLGPVPYGSQFARLMVLLDNLESVGSFPGKSHVFRCCVRDSKTPAKPYTTNQLAGMRYLPTCTSSCMLRRTLKGAGGYDSITSMTKRSTCSSVAVCKYDFRCGFSESTFHTLMVTDAVVSEPANKIVSTLSIISSSFNRSFLSSPLEAINFANKPLDARKSFSSFSFFMISRNVAPIRRRALIALLAVDHGRKVSGAANNPRDRISMSFANCS